jgi:hypothetical protein
MPEQILSGLEIFVISLDFWLGLIGVNVGAFLEISFQQYRQDGLELIW